MARSNIRSWVSIGLAFGLLTSCFVPKYGEFESDAGSPNSNSGGIAAVGGGSSVGGMTNTGGKTNLGGTSGTVGGTSNTAPGGTSATGGAAGNGGSGVKTSVGGTSAAGGSTNIGGNTSTIGGASTTGGAGASSVGGTSSPGGSGNTGGKLNIGGITGTGGISSSPAGGTSASTGNTTAPKGGTAAVTGGATSSGGANPTGGSATAGGVTGTGGSTSPPVPIQISAGYEHACALLSDNSVWCWGRNRYGELGISTTTKNESLTPVKVQFAATGATVKAITAGYYHSCAAFSDGSAQCLGYNEFGQLGDGTTTNTSVPVAVMASANTPLSGIQSISAGSEFTCSVVSDSTYGNIAKCWGDSSFGQLGTGCTGCNPQYPSNVFTNTTNNTPLSGVSSVTAGSSHACAVLTSGATYCWGSNDYGQLGNGSTTDSNVPQQVLDGSSAAISATDVSAGAFATCALVNSGVLCWGHNDYGQVGNESTSTTVLQELRAVPVTRAANPIQSVTQISAGYHNACAVLTSGDVYCWGDGGYGQLGLDPNTTGMSDCSSRYPLCSSTPVLVGSLNILKPNVKISCGNQFLMAWNDSGSAYGLGYNYYGQLGDGNTTDTYTPMPISSSWH